MKILMNECSRPLNTKEKSPLAVQSGTKAHGMCKRHHSLCGDVLAAGRNGPVHLVKGVAVFSMACSEADFCAFSRPRSAAHHTEQVNMPNVCRH